VSEYGHRLEFDENNVAICPESNVKYQLNGKSVEKKSI
jgi:UDP-2-acetamido-3-amino-2,3-dideoxy-glucuronate N-acetyltransferase